MNDLLDSMYRHLALWEATLKDRIVAMKTNDKTYRAICAQCQAVPYDELHKTYTLLTISGIRFMIDESIPDGEVKPMTWAQVDAEFNSPYDDFRVC